VTGDDLAGSVRADGGNPMHAVVGDVLVVRGRHVGDEDREGVIMEVHGSDAGPPYVVRWANGHESVFVPSANTIVEHLPVPRQGS